MLVVLIVCSQKIQCVLQYFVQYVMPTTNILWFVQPLSDIFANSFTTIPFNSSQLTAVALQKIVLKQDQTPSCIKDIAGKIFYAVKTS